MENIRPLIASLLKNWMTAYDISRATAKEDSDTADFLSLEKASQSIPPSHDTFNFEEEREAKRMRLAERIYLNVVTDAMKTTDFFRSDPETWRNVLLVMKQRAVTAEVIWKTEDDSFKKETCEDDSLYNYGPLV